MIVVDVGCVGWVDEVSIEPLVERFQPSTLYAFDPYPQLTPGMEMIGSTRVIRERRAAWIFDGDVGYVENGTRSRVRAGSRAVVPCFDLATWLRLLDEPVVLKLDVEGAEYPLLERIHALGVDEERLDLLLVEWHELPELEPERDSLLARLRCPVEEWS